MEPTAYSQNGYVVLRDNRTTGPLPRLRKTVIPGANRHYYFRDGSVALVLAHFLLWFHETIERIDLGIWDEWGWAVRAIRGKTSGYSNHASGTAFDVNATVHPLGKRLTFKAWQYAKIRARLVLYRGCIRLGLDYTGRPDEMHGEINKPLPAVEKLARALCSTPRGKRILAANPGLLEVIFDGKPPRVITPVKVDEISSRWDRPNDTLKADVDRSAEWADIIALTEVYDRRKALAKMIPAGWTLHQDARDDRAEVAFITRDSVWQAHDFGAKVIGPDVGPGNRIIAALATFAHADGTRFTASITHLPSGVEGDWGGARAKAYRACVANLRREHFEQRRKHKPHGSAAFGDWNLDLHKPWVRAWIKAAWPGLTLPRAAVIPTGATHGGGRLIDWFLRAGAYYVTSWSILPATPGSDHRAIRVAGHINRKA